MRNITKYIKDKFQLEDRLEYIRKMKEQTCDNYVAVIIDGTVQSYITLSLCIEALGKDKVCAYITDGELNIDEIKKVCPHYKVITLQTSTQTW